MKPESRVIRKLFPVLESKPVVALCLPGAEKFGESIKRAGFRVSLKKLDFNFLDWTSSHVVLSEPEGKVTKVFREKGKKPKEIEEVGFLLSLFLEGRKAKFSLGKENHYVVLQETARTGKSLEAVRTALEMNGIPRKNVTTVAIRSSINPLVPPNVIGEKTFVKPHPPRKKGEWLRLGLKERDLLIKVPPP